MVQGALQRSAAFGHSRTAHARHAYSARNDVIVSHSRRSHARVPHSRTYARPGVHQHALHAVGADAVHDTLRHDAAAARLPHAGGAAAQARGDAGADPRVHRARRLAEGGRRLGASRRAQIHAGHARYAAKQVRNLLRC